MSARYLGVEFGSTRIKAVLVDERYRTVGTGSYTWASDFTDGIWTYPLDSAWEGLRAALRELPLGGGVSCMGVSGMMHGYLAFDRNWNLLVPFRTWQNTVTADAAAELTADFGRNIPQRWSVAHLYRAVSLREPHVRQIAHLTTLAGYVHYQLTGVNAVGVGEASGMFPVSDDGKDYDAALLRIFDEKIAGYGLPWRIRDLLPRVLTAGEDAGYLTESGARRLGGLLPAGVPFAPAEGDAGTGMAATNAVSPRTGNVSAGTSVFSMVVLERPLTRVYPEIDVVATPAGASVAMVHCNNCTGDSNAWAGLLKETASLFGAPPAEDVFGALYRKSLEGERDCGGVVVCNYLAGEGVTHLDSGLPLVTRLPGARFTLANFLRATLYSAIVTLKIGMDLLAEEGVAVEMLTGHGGYFKTPGVGQRYMAAACGAKVACMRGAGEGGPYGMALLAAYRAERRGESLDVFLNRVFADTPRTVVSPDPADAAGFSRYTERFLRLLPVERAAAEGGIPCA